MIINDVQYRNSKILLTKFTSAAAALESELGQASDKTLHQLQIDSARAQADDFAREISDYEER